MNAMDKKPAYSAISLTKFRKPRQIYGVSACLCLLLLFTGCDSNSGSGDLYSTDPATPFAELGSVTVDPVTEEWSGTGVGRYLGEAVVLDVNGEEGVLIPASTCAAYDTGNAAGECFYDPDYVLAEDRCETQVVSGADVELCTDKIQVPAGGDVYYFDQQQDSGGTPTGPVCIFQYNTCPDGGTTCAQSTPNYPTPVDKTLTDEGVPEVVLGQLNSDAPVAWADYNQRGEFPGFRMYWRPSTGPLKNKTDLFIFLNGGGACYVDKTQCTTDTNFGEITGINDPATPFSNDLYESPVKDWSYGFVPYCDGSLLLGDVEKENVNADHLYDYPVRIQHGLQNVSAALDVIKKQFVIENDAEPKRILLAGSSAGGFGTISVEVLVRLLWPDIPIYVMNDSGVGIAKWTEPAWLNDRMIEWDSLGVIPASCPYCDANGDMTELLRWQLDHDPNMYMGSYSSYKDIVIGQGFMGLTPDEFMSALVSESARIHEQYPKRFQYFHINGRSHTVLYTPKSVYIIDPESRVAIGINLLFPELLSENGIIAGYEDASVGTTTVIQWLRGMLPERTAAELAAGTTPLPDYNIWKSLSEDGGDSSLTP